MMHAMARPIHANPSCTQPVDPTKGTCTRCGPLGHAAHGRSATTPPAPVIPTIALAATTPARVSSPPGVLEGRARDLLDEFGLHDWAFAWDRAVTAFGTTHFSTHTITLSTPLSSVNTDAHVENTLCHEIAHVLAGPDADHGPTWVMACARTNARVETCSEGTAVAYKWEGSCPKGCGVQARRHRLTKAAREYNICEAHWAEYPDTLRGLLTCTLEHLLVWAQVA